MKPKGVWTRLSEGLPPEGKLLMITYRYRGSGLNKGVDGIFVEDRVCYMRHPWYPKTEPCEWFHYPGRFNDDDLMRVNGEIIAWMEYPEPYTEEGDEEQDLKKMSF